MSSKSPWHGCTNVDLASLTPYDDDGVANCLAGFKFLPLPTNLFSSGMKREQERHTHSIGESPSMAQIQNKQNRDQQYLAVRVERTPQQLEPDVYKAESADYIEDICPYATFQLAKPTYSESSYSGNVYSGSYHSVRGSFVYHDVKPPPIDKFKLGHVSF